MMEVKQEEFSTCVYVCIENAALSVLNDCFSCCVTCIMNGNVLLQFFIVLFYFILFYFILFYFILFILFYFTLQSTIYS